MRIMTKRYKSLILVLGTLTVLLCLTACGSPQPQQESASPEAVQTQTVDSTQAPQESDSVDQDSAPTVGGDDTDIPDEGVDFGA